MHQRTNRPERHTLTMRHLLFLACVVPAITLCHVNGASAVRSHRGAVAIKGAGNAAVEPAAARGAAFSGPRAAVGPHAGLAPHGRPVGHPADEVPGQQRGHGLEHDPARAGPGHALPHNPAGLGQERALLRNGLPIGRPFQNAIARNGLPYRPFPGEAGFTGVPPRGETRFVSNELIVHLGSEVSPQALDAAARRMGLTQIASQNLSLSGGRLVHFRIANGQQVEEVVRTLEAEKIGIAQPNYVFLLQQDTQAAAPSKGDPAQYVVDKLHLHDAHSIASGANVAVAIIDSLVDAAHPDLAGSIAGQFDAVATADKPDEHGTGMTGAIVAHRRLLGVAPRARILAIHAFSPDAQHPQQATTQNIVAGIDWAIARGVRIINMSFAGPYDPMLQLALKKAHDKGVVLIAAAGNMGPQSPPLYPAADENVIAVTAVDENDKLMPQANQGPHVALAAPGVNVLEAAPRATYNFTTGTSVAAAHVSGAAALILERNPALDVATLEEVLFSTARDLGVPGRDSMFGYGLVDPYRALNALEAKVASGGGLPATTASANAKPVALATPSKPPPGAAALVSGVPAAPIGPATPLTSPGSKPGSAPPAGKLTVSQIEPSVPATPVAVAPAAAEPDESSPATIEKKRLSCRQNAAAKGVRGAEMEDYIAVCVSEARLACLKQAVAQKVHGEQRRDFMNRCLGS
ncbi:MAG TPA: S8 family serine peptidase [Xanthobacteraceae bacterium]|nr:S8 family serine peptidase [Xanthobacteraceae bacterium]